MYVCHCAAVTDTTIRETIADGATDLVEVGRRCGAGINCGGCVPRLCALLAEAGCPTAGPVGTPGGVCLPALRARSVLRARVGAQVQLSS